MVFDGNVAAWLADAPENVRATTADLLERADHLRETEEVFPPQRLILNALATTAPDAVRVVVLGQDPYHEPGQAMGLAFSVPQGVKIPPSLRNIYKELASDLALGQDPYHEPGQAMGLAFSVPQGVKIPPSLRNIYKELASDLAVPVPQSGDLTPWAREGVLLLNTSLTVAAGKAASHSKLGWQVLTNYVVGECLMLPRPVVFLAWGKHAIGVIESARAAVGAVENKCVLASTHPSPLSASRPAGDIPAFLGSHPFSRANEFLVAHGERPIDWACLA